MYTVQKTASNNKLTIFKLVVLLVFVILGLGTVFIFSTHKTPVKHQASQISKIPATKVTASSSDISMLLTGDWIAHDSVNSAAMQADGTYNYLPLVYAYAPLFKKTDIKFCNDPILNGGNDLGISGYPKFNSPTDFVTDMGRFGCNLVNTASNHSSDFTQANINASVDAWSKVPNMLAVAGENRNQAEHDAIHYFTVKGVKFAFLAYMTYSNSPPQNTYGVNVYSPDVAASQIKTAKDAGAQIIIVSMRWGVEYSPTISPVQDSAAKFLNEHGADLVLGHGPHVLQPAQEITGPDGHKTLVWYSLGNFLNTQEPPETLFNGVPVLNINPKTLAVTTKGFLPFYMHYEWTPEQAKADATNSRTNVKMYLLDDATQPMIDSQQLKTTVEAQKQRLQATLNGRGLTITLLTAQKL